MKEIVLKLVTSFLLLPRVTVLRVVCRLGISSKLIFCCIIYAFMIYNKSLLIIKQMRYNFQRRFQKGRGILRLLGQAVPPPFFFSRISFCIVLKSIFSSVGLQNNSHLEYLNSNAFDIYGMWKVATFYLLHLFSIIILTIVLFTSKFVLCNFYFDYSGVLYIYGFFFLSFDFTVCRFIFNSKIYNDIPVASFRWSAINLYLCMVFRSLEVTVLYLCRHLYWHETSNFKVILERGPTDFNQFF